MMTPQYRARQTAKRVEQDHRAARRLGEFADREANVTHRAHRARDLGRASVVAVLVLLGALRAGPVAAGQAGDLKTFCRTTVDLIQHVLTEGAIPDEDASPEKIAKFEKKVAKLLNQAEQTAPAEIANDVSFASELTRGNARAASAYPVILQILEPIQAIKRFVAATCGFKTVAVTAREYEFHGIPKTLETGTVVFELRNEGAELHDMAFGRIKGDASLKALLELPERERLKLNRIEELGAGALAAPGESDVALVGFTKPGRYAVACFVPVGTTSVGADTAGPPHTHEGMFAEFQVKKKR